MPEVCVPRRVTERNDVESCRFFELRMREKKSVRIWVDDKKKEMKGYEVQMEEEKEEEIERGH